MRRYELEKEREGSTVYFFIRDVETLDIVLLPTKYLMHKIRSKCSPNTVRRSALAILYYLEYIHEKKKELTDVYLARAMIIHQMLGTRISDTLTLRKDCLYKHDRQDMIIIYQPKTRRYEKPISRELAQLIGKAVSYANEHYPESIYIFADENKPERPISYQTLQDKVLRMIYEKDIRDDSGNLFGFGTHMFRHCYGVKLTELHVDDWTIAKLLGHKGVRSVQYYRKMSNQRMADETREVRNFMSQIILASLDGWGEEYEQIRQDAGIE